MSTARKFIDSESMGANIATQWIDTGRRRHVGITLLASGTPNGTLGVRVANAVDRDGNKIDEVTLPNAAIVSGALTQPAGAGVNQAVVIEVHTRFVGIDYTRTGGTGTLDGYWAAKDE